MTGEGRACAAAHGGRAHVEARSAVRASLWVALLVLATSTHAADLTLDARRADFAELATLVADQYVYLDGRRARWASVGERYRARVDAATTADAWSAVIEDALAELRDFHVGMNPGSERRALAVPTSADLWAVPDADGVRVVAVRAGTDAARAGLVAGERIERIDGQASATAIAQMLGDGGDAQDAGARAWAVLSLVTGRFGEKREFVVRGRDGATRTVTLPAQRRVDRPADPVTWSRLPDGVGVIRFNNSLGRQETVAAFDAALAALRDTRGLVVDLRDTPSGGNSGVALGVLGRFVDRRMPYQRHRIPRYGQDDVERNWVEEIAPRGTIHVPRAGRRARRPLDRQHGRGHGDRLRCGACRDGGRLDDGAPAGGQRRLHARAYRRAHLVSDRGAVPRRRHAAAPMGAAGAGAGAGRGAGRRCCACVCAEASCPDA